MQRLLATLIVMAALAAFSAATVSAGPQSREQLTPAIAFNIDPRVQNFLVVWVEDRGHGNDIFAKRLFINGLPHSGPSSSGWKVIRDDYETFRGAVPPGPRADPNLYYNASRAEYLLTFSQQDDTDGWDIYSVRLSHSGFAQGKPRRLAGGPGDQRRPDAALMSDRGVRQDDYLVVWEDNARDIDEVWALRLQANGIPRGNPYVLVRGASNASDPTTSGAAVAWVDDRGGQADIYSIQVRNGLAYGRESAVASDNLEEFNPRYSSNGLLWNVFDPATGVDIMGVPVIEDSRLPTNPGVIVVPAADQMWPDMENNIVVFSDNRSGEYDLYAVRVVSGGRIRAQGHDYPVMTDF